MPNHSAFLEWQTVETLITQHLSQDRITKPISPSQYLSLLEAVRQQLQKQIAHPLAQAMLPDSTMRYVTELHRLVRLSLTDVALWQGARSPELQQQRLEQLLSRLVLLRHYVHAIVGALSEA
jgi:hypothetical protein